MTLARARPPLAAGRRNAAVGCTRASGATPLPQAPVDTCKWAVASTWLRLHGLVCGTALHASAADAAVAGGCWLRGTDLGACLRCWRCRACRAWRCRSGGGQCGAARERRRDASARRIAPQRIRAGSPTETRSVAALACAEMGPTPAQDEKAGAPPECQPPVRSRWSPRCSEQRVLIGCSCTVLMRGAKSGRNGSSEQRLHCKCVPPQAVSQRMPRLSSAIAQSGPRPTPRLRSQCKKPHPPRSQHDGGQVTKSVGTHRARGALYQGVAFGGRASGHMQCMHVTMPGVSRRGRQPQ